MPVSSLPYVRTFCREESSDPFTDVIYEAQITDIIKPEPGVLYAPVIRFLTRSTEAACGVKLDEDKEYLLDLRRRESTGQLWSYLCGMTQPWDQLTDEKLDILERGCGHTEQECDCGEFQVGFVAAGDIPLQFLPANEKAVWCLLVMYAGHSQSWRPFPRPVKFRNYSTEIGTNGPLGWFRKHEASDHVNQTLARVAVGSLAMHHLIVTLNRTWCNETTYPLHRIHPCFGGDRNASCSHSPGKTTARMFAPLTAARRAKHVPSTLRRALVPSFHARTWRSASHLRSRQM